MILAEEKQSGLDAAADRPSARLSPLETEVIDLFVQLSRLLGHPCKIYNVRSVAAPVLYIGPQPSHVTEILDAIGDQAPCAMAAHGHVDCVVQHIQRFRHDSGKTNRRALARIGAVFSKEAVLPKLIAELESG